MLVCQDRECGYKETLSRTTNARCPKCHKRMEMYVKGKEETLICACGYKEKLSAFQARRANEAALRAMGLEAIASPRSGSGSDSGFGGFGNTGFAPSPKKERPASSIIIVPISNTAVTRIGPKMIGRICFKIIFPVPHPDNQAAFIKTVSFCASV